MAGIKLIHAVARPASAPVSPSAQGNNNPVAKGSSQSPLSRIAVKAASAARELAKRGERAVQFSHARRDAGFCAGSVIGLTEKISGPVSGGAELAMTKRRSESNEKVGVSRIQSS